MRIDRLTPEQEAQISAIRDEWLAVGLCTEPADRSRAEAGVASAYRAAGLEPPRIVIWLGSPVAGAVGAVLLAQTFQQGKIWDQVRAQVRDQAWDQVGNQVGAQVWDQVMGQVEAQVWAQVGDQVGAQVWAQVWAQVQFWAQIWDQVKDQVGGQVGAQVWDQVGNQIKDQVWDQVRDQVRAQIWAQAGVQIRDQVRAACYGQHDAGWLAFFDFFVRACPVRGAERLSGMQQVARAAGWWWPMRDAVILTERPSILRRDEEGRLHAEDGPALMYPDGWGIWAWHGVRVPQQVIEAPETLTVEQIREERNVEVRRVMLERFGTERYLRESNAEQVHRDEWGTLYRVRFEDDEDLYMVEVVNSTPEPDGTFRDYFIRVHPQLRPMLPDGGYGAPQELTARNAVASTFGLRGEEYSPAVQT